MTLNSKNKNLTRRLARILLPSSLVLLASALSVHPYAHKSEHVSANDTAVLLSRTVVGVFLFVVVAVSVVVLLLLWLAARAVVEAVSGLGMRTLHFVLVFGHCLLLFLELSLLSLSSSCHSSSPILPASSSGFNPEMARSLLPQGLKVEKGLWEIRVADCIGRERQGRCPDYGESSVQAARRDNTNSLESRRQHRHSSTSSCLDYGHASFSGTCRIWPYQETPTLTACVSRV